MDFIMDLLGELILKLLSKLWDNNRVPRWLRIVVDIVMLGVLITSSIVLIILFEAIWAKIVCGICILLITGLLLFFAFRRNRSKTK